MQVQQAQIMASHVGTLGLPGGAYLRLGYMAALELHMESLFSGLNDDTVVIVT